MKKVFMVLIIAAFAFGVQGCYKHTFNVGNGAPNGKQVYNSWLAVATAKAYRETNL